MSIAVYVVDDHALVRHGLVSVINPKKGSGSWGWRRRGGNADRDQALATAGVSGGPRNADTSVRRSHRHGQGLRCPRLRVVVCTMHAANGYVAEALRRGADGYCSRAARAISSSPPSMPSRKIVASSTCPAGGSCAAGPRRRNSRASQPI